MAVEWDSTNGIAGHPDVESPFGIGPGCAMPAGELPRFRCQNPACDAIGQRGGDHLLVINLFGKARHRLLYRQTRKARFSEFKGTPLFNSKLPREKVLAVREHLAKECGVRRTARLVGVNKDTVTRLALMAG